MSLIYPDVAYIQEKKVSFKKFKQSNLFEEYFLKDQNYLKNISPAIYNKIEGLLEDENR